jgi:hypothetical protein
VETEETERERVRRETVSGETDRDRRRGSKIEKRSAECQREEK